MSTTKLDVANAAIALVGGKPIAAFDDGSAEGEKCQHLYEVVVGKALTAPGGAPFRWRFASAQASLAALADSPVARWPKAWQLPTGCLKVHAVTANDVVVPFDLYGDSKLLTDAWDSVVADYSFRPEEARWPGDFTHCVVHELAAELALALAENRTLHDMLVRRIDWAGARAADSQQRTAPRLRATRLTGARHAARSVFGGW